MQKFLVYLFDFDGTLFDSIRACKYVFKKAYANLNIEINEDDVVGWTREPLGVSYKRIGAPQEKFAKFFKDITDYVNSKEATELTDLYPETYDTVIDLRMAEADLAVVTSNTASHVRDVLKKFEMQKDFFSVIVGNQETNKVKPDPEPIFKALEMMNYHGDLKDVCYVGDALNDCLAAVNAGVVPVLVDRHDEYRDTSYLRIKSLAELLS